MWYHDDELDMISDIGFAVSVLAIVTAAAMAVSLLLGTL